MIAERVDNVRPMLQSSCTVVRKRASEHKHRNMADQTAFPLSMMVEMLVTLTFPFLERMSLAVGSIRDGNCQCSGSRHHFDCVIWSVE